MSKIVGALSTLATTSKFTAAQAAFAIEDVKALLTQVEAIKGSTYVTTIATAFKADGKDVGAIKTDSTDTPKIIADSATSSGTSKAVSDAKSDISDAISSAIEDTNELKVSEKISDAVKYYEKTTYKGIADVIKTVTKEIDDAVKAAGKFKIETNMGSVHTNGLQIAFTLASFQNYLLQKHVAINKHYADVCWAFIQKAASQYSAVTKQRNLGENANVSTSDKSTSVLSQFGF